MQCSSASAKYLVVDTSAFINTLSLHKVGEKVYTVAEVIDEIRNKRQYRHFFSLTQDVEVKTVFGESIAFVTDFAKKTGDYASLSATDIKLLALTYQLESQFVGSDHLRKSPIFKQFQTNVKANHKHPVCKGLSLPINVDKYDRRQEQLILKEPIRNYTSDNADNNINESNELLEDEASSSDELNFADCEATEEYDDYETATELSPSNSENESLSENSDETYELESESDLDGDSDDNDGTWITPSNISELKRSSGTSTESTRVVVGCLTTDFAIQNVLLQIGLNVITTDGKLIKELRTYILRCYACYKTTTNMRKVFCPTCGNKTLKKVSVYLDKDGNKQMFINFKKNISTRGKRFSLPNPKGGKHAINPRLVEDARKPHQRPSKLARTKTNALEEDYVANLSPFVLRDVHSKSAQLGFNKGRPVFKYWMRKNPNESRRLPKT